MKNHYSVKGISDTEIENDYEFAIVHLLWYTDKDRQNHLIFGMVECYPKEILTAYELDEQSEMFYDCQVHYIRVRKKSRDAILWYTNCMKTGFLTVDWYKDPKMNENIFCGDLTGVIKWPHFSLTDSENGVTPFISKEWGVVRAYHLFPKECKKFLLDFIAHEEISNWINKYLLWDINDFRGLLGSIHLILPNPIYRVKKQRLIVGDGTKTDTIKVEFIPRKEASVKGLQIYSLEKNNLGIAGGHCININSNVLYLQQVGRVEECGFIINCPQRGLIDYSPFAGFIRGINFNIEIATDAGSKDLNSDKKLEKKNLTEKLDQKMFLNDTKRAVDFIREKFENAQERIIIVEPYFSSEVFTFALEVKPKNIQMQILIIDSTIDQELYMRLREENEIHVFIMPEQAIIRDRLLVIDNEVWLLGSSLKSIGEGINIIVRVPYSEEILERINQIIINSKTVMTLDNRVGHDGEEQD